METIKLFEMYKNNFLDYLKKTKKWAKIEEASIKNEEDITKAIRIAYSTACRTFDFEDKKKGKNNFCALAREFKNYMDTTILNQNEFDAAHERLCKFIQCNKDKIFVRRCKDGVPSYGQCQKIVNVTLKILYCFKDAELGKSYFLFGHMILDRYTLKWYCNYCGGEKNIMWSQLDKDKYQQIQKNIRAKIQATDFDNSLPKNVFQAEFIIWEEERQAVATTKK